MKSSTPVLDAPYVLVGAAIGAWCCAAVFHTAGSLIQAVVWTIVAAVCWRW